MDDDLPRPRSMSRTGYRVHLVQVVPPRHGADLAALIAAGCGEMPLVQMKWRSGNCGSRLTEFIVGGSHMRPSSS
jgi:hypothetical protein